MGYGENMSMKRYRIVYINSRHPRMDELEDQNGKWVKADDVAALETRLQNAERLLKELGVVATSSSVKERYPELLNEVAEFINP